ncbi:fimbrial protein [Aeromonas salmonicida]|uniref:fimbrial protein n=1 Tax=Aeromonas salmonicida TaxID=645 RepID=UPI003D00C03F
MKIQCFFHAAIIAICSVSSQSTLASYDSVKDSVNISVTGFVEAETCKLIESEMPDLTVDMGTIPLKSLQEMRDGKASYGVFKVNKKVSFRCDGAAKKVNFTMQSNSAVCPIASSSNHNNRFLCNEVENGASVGLAYRTTWIDDSSTSKEAVIYGPYNMNTIQSGKINDGKFDMELKDLYYGPYKDQETVSPGEIKGHLLITVWNI